MKIVRPYARMMAPVASQGTTEFTFMPFELGHGLDLLQRVEWCARVSHRSEDKVTNDSWKRIIQSVVLDHGDWSVTEHCSVSVDMLVDRGITHELVRHRLASYTQESTRFVRYFKEKDGDIIQPAKFIYPKPDVECDYCLKGLTPEEDDLSQYGERWIHDLANGEFDCAYDPIWLGAMQAAEQRYKSLTNLMKWRPQEARSVLPNALASRIIVTMNLRAWRHVLIMRTTQETHPQFRQVSIPLLKEFQAKIPLLYDDIVPLQKQSEAIKKAR